jgi:hypothetical protein
MVRSFFRIALVALLAGCSYTPARVEAPSWDPDNFADAILERLDKNADGAVDMTEVAAAPGLAWGAQYIDTDNNKSLSRDELVARFEVYRKMRLGLSSKTMQLSYKGRPLMGAKVKLVPEFFLEGVVEPAEGETFSDGTLSPQAQGIDLPGVRVGYYRVVVDAPNLKLPAKYASADTTLLGVEVSPTSDNQRAYGKIPLILRD